MLAHKTTKNFPLEILSQRTDVENSTSSTQLNVFPHRKTCTM